MMLPFNPFTGPEHQAFTLNGGRPAVLLVHGYPGTPHELRPLAEHLNTLGWTAHAMLLPGFGPELETLPERRLPEWTEAVAQSLQELREQHDPVVIVGFSLGGALALATAPQTQPDRLILLSPFWRFEHVLWKSLPVLRRILPNIKPFRLIKPDFSNPEMRQGMADFMPGIDLDDPAVQAGMRDFSVPIAMFDELRKAGQQAEQAVRHATAPLLVLQGSEDELVPPGQTRRLVQDYGGAVRYLEVPAGHDLPDAAKPAWPQVVAAITRFLTEI